MIACAPPLAMDATPTDSAAPPTPARLARHAARYGGIAGAIGGVWMMCGYALSVHPRFGTVGGWVSFLVLIVPISAAVLGIVGWRNDALGGRIRFTQAFGMALAIGLVCSACLGLAAWLHAAVIQPDLIDRLLELDAARRSAAPEADAEAIAREIEQARATLTPARFGQSVFAGRLIESFFIGLIASITVPKKRPGME